MTIFCFLCGKPVDVRRDRNDKRYFVCDPCGVQCFVRRAAGIDRLERLTDAMAIRSAVFEQGGVTLYQAQSILSAIDGLRAEITRLEPHTGWFGDEALIQARRALEKRLNRFLKQLEELP
jgi:hypothetical protein